MKRVLHLTKRYPPYIGGIETVCHDMAAALKGKYEQLVIAFNDGKETVKDCYEGVDVIRVGVNRVVASQPLCRDYRSVLDEAFRVFKPDIIHFDYPNPYVAFYLLKAMKRYRFSGRLLVFWHADIIKQKLLKLLFVHQNNQLIRLADRIVVTSPNYLVNTSYLPKVSKEKIRIVPLRIGDARLTITQEQRNEAVRIKGRFSDRKIIFFFGRHVPYKGLEYLLKANSELEPNRAVLLIAGSGPLTKELKEKSSTAKNVFFLGRLSDSDINSYLLACDVFAFPSVSRNEAFGISLAEALSFGKPSVTFTIPGSGVNWVSPNNVSGLEAPNKDYHILAANIMRLLDDEALSSRLSSGARERYEQFFTPKLFEDNILSIFDEF